MNTFINTAVGNPIAERFHADLAAVRAEAVQAATPSSYALHEVERLFSTVAPEFVSFERMNDNCFQMFVTGFRLRHGRKLVVARFQGLEHEMSGPIWKVEVRTRWSFFTGAYEIGNLEQMVRHCTETPAPVDPFS